MAENDKIIYVCEQWSSDQPKLLGTLWKYMAKKNGLSRRDIEYMQPAFNAVE